MENGRSNLAFGLVQVGETADQDSFYLLAYIEAVCLVLDPNPMPPGFYQYSFVLSCQCCRDENHCAHKSEAQYVAQCLLLVPRP